MPTISLCMIVKNEADILPRCLDGLADLMDEIIIVDTGSTDNTKEVAASYTDKVFDFEWCDDFSAARNYSFSKATMDYIYAPDADEVIDEENLKAFAKLKECLLPEIEIVQMNYVTPEKFNTVENSKTELRPKLFKRLRSFCWINPIHETVRLDPVVFDSDIDILHLPKSSHGKRDFCIFKKSYLRDGRLNNSIITMYAKELLKCGDDNDFEEALEVFENIKADELALEKNCILSHCYRIMRRTEDFFTVTLEAITSQPCSEICYELGLYYYDRGQIDIARLWFNNAIHNSNACLNIDSENLLPKAMLEKI